MLLTISTTQNPATDLGFLLHKHPGKLQSFELSFGNAHVFYPEATDEKCTAALLVEVDPVRLVRGHGASMDQYVNDRPYAASSLLSVAINRVFGTALSGKCRGREQLASAELPLEAFIPAISCGMNEDGIRRVFEPLGYQVDVRQLQLDEQHPEWAESGYFSLRLRNKLRLKHLLEHLYVLVPVLDAEKHYWVDKDEVAKLVRKAGEWLAVHPDKELIVRRYLMYQRGLMHQALQMLTSEDGIDPDEQGEKNAIEEAQLERKVSLHEQRLKAVLDVLKSSGASRIVDLGCGEGKLLRMLLKEKQFTEIVGMDVSHRALEIAERKLRIDRMPMRQRGRIRLIHGSLSYRDRRIEGFDAAAIVEVIEHLDEYRLSALSRIVFEFACPRTVVVTTPNREYNILFEGMEEGRLRHRDHRFEWTRAEFRAWAQRICEGYGYSVAVEGVGPEDPVFGCPTQMAVFRR